VAVPSLRRPWMLLPESSPRSAAQALRRFSNGGGGGATAGSIAAALAVRGGLMRAWRSNRVSLGVIDGTPAADLPGLLLREHLAGVLGRDDLSLAVRVGATRPNGKPVVQVLGSSGMALAFVKIGWNDLTRPLVVREGEVLAAFSAPQSAPLAFDVPRLIHRSEWNGFRLLVVAPIAQRGLPAGPGAPLQPTREVAAMGGVTRSPLAGSPWWSELTGRLAAADHAGLAATRTELERRFGGHALAFGGAHGDWTPWNMARSRGRLVVWDWERFTLGAPVGQDAIHYAFMVALRRRKRTPEQSAEHAVHSTPPLITAMGGDPNDGPLLVMLHHLEMAVRFAEARAAGVTVVHDLFAQQLVRLLAAG
jgi:hypothetical protein